MFLTLEEAWMDKKIKVREVLDFLRGEFKSDGYPLPSEVILFVGPERYHYIQKAGGNRYRMSWADPTRSKKPGLVKHLSRIVSGDDEAILLLPEPAPKDESEHKPEPKKTVKKYSETNK
jgi:hypothetical protein